MGFYKNTNSGYEQYLEKIYKSTVESLNPMCEKIMPGFRSRTDRWMIILYVNDNKKFDECYRIVEEYTKALDIEIHYDFYNECNSHMFIEFNRISDRDKVHYLLKEGVRKVRDGIKL